MRSGTAHCIGLALLILCCGILDLKSGDALSYVDEIDYEQSARSIVNHHEFADADGKLTMARPPGYPMAIALVYLAVQRPVAAKIENALFLGLAVLALGIIARRLTTNSDALVPYLVLAYPLLIYCSTLLYPQVLGCLLLTVTVALVARDRFRRRDAILAGLCYGVLILAIPYFILLLPVFGAFILFKSGSSRSVSLQLAVIMMGACALLVVPWTVRNYANFHVLVPVSANNGKNLFIGNSPVTTPTSGRTADVLPLCKGVHAGMTEYEFDTTMGNCAKVWIWQHPADAARLYVGKVVNYFNYRNEIATPGESTRWRDWLVFFTYYPLLLLALARAALAHRFPLRKEEALIYALYFLNVFASAVFFPRLRFRIPFDFLLIGINAAFLARWWSSRAVASTG